MVQHCFDTQRNHGSSTQTQGLTRQHEKPNTYIPPPPQFPTTCKVPSMAKTETIKQNVSVPATPEEVYEAFIDPKKHSKFTGSKATCDPKVGGKFTAWDGYISGKNLQLEPAKKILQEWQTTDWPEGQPPSTLELTLKKTGTGTQIIMKHSGVPADQAADTAQGWIDWYWEPLKKYFKKQPSTKASSTHR
jgi:activator of HSP90 ATPase